MIHFFIPEHSLFSIPASIIATIFVILDFVSFIIQLVGGSLAGPNSPPEDQMKAIHIYMGGIGLQQFFICVFVVLAVKFQRRMTRFDKMEAGSFGEKSTWKKLLITLYVSLGLISVRNLSKPYFTFFIQMLLYVTSTNTLTLQIRIIFRLIQFSGGHGTSNPLITNEGLFYALEAVPMLLALFSFNFVHPGKVLVGPAAEMPGFATMFKGMWRGRRGTQTKWQPGNSMSSLAELGERSH